ncbi:unnamed protein product [Nyctereutes procyonoides]|uniref:(raccoon dog) hypothetical protein n=1 Tax=Nyctereutes procyonoides TaxID=34880 RepID=A0A811YYG8_NYCPR|nr:unnamed protein product [Nyctereutes procyonoides]
MAAGVKALAEVVMTETKMEKESGANPTKSHRAFITNISFAVKWHSLKGLVKEKVGEVTYMELLVDSEGKYMPPLKVKEDSESEHARGAMQKAGRLGSTVFVVQADILEDKDEKSHGIGTITFEQSIEAVQALSMSNGQLLFDRPMHQLPHGLHGIVLGLDAGGQLTDDNHLNKGIGMGNRTHRNGNGRHGGTFWWWIESMDRFGSGMNMGTINNGDGSSVPGIKRMGPSINRMGGGLSLVMDCVGLVEHMGSSTLNHMASSIKHMGQTMECIRSGVECMGLSMEYICMGPTVDCMATGLEHMGTNNLERMGLQQMGTNSLKCLGLEHMSPAIGPALDAGIEHMGLAMGGSGSGSASFDRAIKMEHSNSNLRGNFAGSFGRAGGHAPWVCRKACQIFVRNLPFDFTWKMLKDKFNECGHMLYADTKMENGKSKGCGVVQFESPEVIERAYWMMNGMKLSDLEIDVRINRKA